MARSGSVEFLFGTVVLGLLAGCPAPDVPARQAVEAAKAVPPATSTGAPSTPASVPTPAVAPAEVYTCPMHPEFVQDHPGTCPKCSMDLVKQ